MKTNNDKRIMKSMALLVMLSFAAYANTCYENNPPSEQACGGADVSCYYFNCNGVQTTTSCDDFDLFVQVIAAPKNGYGEITGIPCTCPCTWNCNGVETYNECCTIRYLHPAKLHCMHKDRYLEPVRYLLPRLPTTAVAAWAVGCYANVNPSAYSCCNDADFCADNTLVLTFQWRAARGAAA